MARSVPTCGTTNQVRPRGIYRERGPIARGPGVYTGRVDQSREAQEYIPGAIPTRAQHGR
eukprot:1192403-Prorocentrum_minimum.AAC.1